VHTRPNPEGELLKKEDEQDLRHFGYTQELFRTIGGFSNFAISFSIISILTGAVTLYDYGLQMGGPAEMAFGWPLVALFTLAVAASMGELASAFPTSGGMYHWSTLLGGPGWGWFTAWFNIVGLLATLAAVDYGCAQFVTPFLGISSSGTVLLVYAVILLSQALINHYGIQLVAWLNDFSVTVHIVGVVAIVGILLLFAPRQPLSFFVHRQTANHSAYWWAFMLGLLQAQWTFTGYDASAHVSEETVDPRRRVPWGIVNSVAISAVVGYLLLLAITLSIRSIPAVLGATDASGNKIPAVIAICRQAVGYRAGGILSLLAAMAMWFCGLATVTSSSRTIYAFARDDGMPLSGLWRTVVNKHLTPAPAIWLSVGMAFVLSIYSKTYSVITSISVLGLYVSYVLPVWLGWRARRAHSWTQRGPWHLGAYSSAVNVVAISWTGLMCIIMMMPPNQLAGETLAGLTLALLLWFTASERHRFKAGSALKAARAAHLLESRRS
jgi:amino acid transporter